MCNLYRRPSIVAFYQVAVHLAKQIERGRFYKIGTTFSESKARTFGVSQLATNVALIEYT
jgi:hypothetical protein